MFPPESAGTCRTLDGYAALTYDAAYTAVRAAVFLVEDGVTINGRSMWPALMSITEAADAKRGYEGVTGPIDFGGTVGRRVPINKPVTIVRFENGAPVAGKNVTCAGPGDAITKPWCPFD